MCVSSAGSSRGQKREWSLLLRIARFLKFFIENDVSLLPGGDTGKRADVKTSILHSALKPMFFTCINTGLKNIQSV